MLAHFAVCGGRIFLIMRIAAIGIGACYSAWSAPPGVTDQDRDRIHADLSAIGIDNQLAEESQIDRVTAASGSSSAYPA
ncbi:pyrroline-5-carboxylate reductase family protein [Paracoccus beibuensis]|uniref:hypothetical protein n=1 Tax=Paracoccus beibuensis TaxID=547602 RepID=UPI0022405296|nr:hypothetical protein [Paracoccus beibuensis]